MDERESNGAPRKLHDDDSEVGRLLEAAGPRPEIPEEHLEAITRAARGAWRRQVEVVSRRPSDRDARLWAAGLAAGVILAVAALWWWVGPHSAAPATVARVEAASGTVRLSVGRDGTEEVTEGLDLASGTEVRTGGGDGAGGHVALSLAGGVTLRAGSGTRLLLAAADRVELLQGAVYVDTGVDGASPPAGTARGEGRIEVATPAGTATDVGTRFAVRLVGPGLDRSNLDGSDPDRSSWRALSVRVRDGVVSVARGARSFRASAGEEIVLHRDGTVERGRAPAYGDAWGWVLAAAPGFDLEGRTLTDFLDWVSRETGWSVRFEDRGLAAAAEEILLHGSLGELRPDQAPFAVLPGAGLEGSLDGGTLTVRRAAPL